MKQIKKSKLTQILLIVLVLVMGLILALTKGFNNININEWEDLVKIFTSYSLPVGTQIKIAFSTTSGDSWFYFNNIKDLEIKNLTVKNAEGEEIIRNNVE